MLLATHHPRTTSAVRQHDITTASVALQALVWAVTLTLVAARQVAAVTQPELAPSSSGPTRQQQQQPSQGCYTTGNAHQVAFKPFGI
jgi:hypothetical protein